jgi:TrmH family RNA methyltransferase
VITSTTNERVKFVRALSQRKTRQEKGRFVVEGVRLCEEAFRANAQPEFVFYTADIPQRGRDLIVRWHNSGVVCLDVSLGVMKVASDTETPAGILAVLPFVERRLPQPPTLSVIADGLRDPGNCGSLLRTAAAAGADEVLLGPGTVDVYNAKVVRAAMGAHFRLPIAALTWPAIASHLSGVQVWLADAHGELTYTDVDWSAPSALIIGSEAAGASAEAQKLASGRMRIPLYNDVESLNATAAAAVVLFEARRQRAATPAPDGVK